jgi:hypothetical protein
MIKSESRSIQEQIDGNNRRNEGKFVKNPRLFQDKRGLR